MKLKSYYWGPRLLLHKNIKLNLINISQYCSLFTDLKHTRIIINTISISHSINSLINSNGI